jgi:predicted neuraminidase
MRTKRLGDIMDVLTLRVFVSIFLAIHVTAIAANDAVLTNEFIYDKASFPSCHASTIEHTPRGLVAAWFGGTDEGNSDVGIWVARHDGNKWSAPVEVANGVESPAKRYPCWNPVLFQMPDGPLMLYYKVGPNPREWWGMWIASRDSGKTWTAPQRLPEGILGPIKNKPVLVGDRLLAPSSTEHDGWRAHLEWSDDGGKTWKKTDSLEDHTKFDVIQPTILVHPEGKLQILCRSRQRQIVESWSSDGGLTWSKLAATELPNNNSGIDAAKLSDGRFVLIYNHTQRGRTPINLAISSDGNAWQAGLVLESEPGEYSYPAVIVTPDGLIHTTYTWKRQRIKHVVVDPKKLSLKPIEMGQWPK